MGKALILLLLSLPVAAQTMQMGTNAVPNPTGGGGGPTITLTSAVCTGNAASLTVNCTLGASAAVGDLLLILTKSSSLVGTATVAYSFTGTASCTPTAILAPGTATFQSNGSGHFITAMAGCIITTAGANVPQAVWTGADASFSDIEVGVYHTTNTWKTTFLDQISTPNIATATATTCPTGTTASTTNANDLIIATCQVFNVGQTWGTLSGFTSRAALERNTTGWYDKSVTSTGTQTATVPLSVTDFGLGFIVAFASN
jgi:hypothetical protein